MSGYGDGPIEEKYRLIMNNLAGAVDEYLNLGRTGKDRQVGFVLLVFPYGEGEGRCNYISNGASREDMVMLLREQANRFEQSIKEGQH